LENESPPTAPEDGMKRKTEVNRRRRSASYLAVLLLTLRLTTLSAFAQESPQDIATGGLNEFDLALFCGEAGQHADSGPFPASGFGYATLSAGGVPEFAFVTARYYVETGPYGDPQGCAFRRYLYRLEGELFRREEIDKNRFIQIQSSIRSFERTYERLNPGKRLSFPSGSSEDSVGGCLFPIAWYAIGGQDYALLSVAAEAGIVNYVIPQSERRLNSTCQAWGERHLTNSSITSNEIGFLSISPDLLFIESKTYRTGFLLRPSLDFQCFRGGDAFSHHILISRPMFDLKIRPALDNLLLKHNTKLKVADPKGQPKVLTFPDSVRLNQEFAAFVVGLTNEKGCI
jgi:hypothetical protein